MNTVAEAMKSVVWKENSEHQFEMERDQMKPDLPIYLLYMKEDPTKLHLMCSSTLYFPDLKLPQRVHGQITTYEYIESSTVPGEGTKLILTKVPNVVMDRYVLYVNNGKID